MCFVIRVRWNFHLILLSFQFCKISKPIRGKFWKLPNSEHLTLVYICSFSTLILILWWWILPTFRKFPPFCSSGFQACLLSIGRYYSCWWWLVCCWIWQPTDIDISRSAQKKLNTYMVTFLLELLPPARCAAQMNSRCDCEKVLFTYFTNHKSKFLRWGLVSCKCFSRANSMV